MSVFKLQQKASCLNQLYEGTKGCEVFILLTGFLLKHSVFAGSERLSLCLGAGVLTLTGPAVATDEWYTVRVTRMERRTWLSVNSVSVYGEAPADSVGLTLENYIWLGGVSNNTVLNPRAIFHTGFQGCIHDFKVINLLIDMTCKQKCAHVYVHTCTDTDGQTDTHAHTHTRTHIYICTHTHAPTHPTH